jgi:apolipoprotein N-acyltransferase
MPDSTTESQRIRRKSMQGTALFVLGILAALAFAVTGAIWLLVVAVVLLLPAIVMLYQVGRSLP